MRRQRAADDVAQSDEVELRRRARQRAEGGLIEENVFLRVRERDRIGVFVTGARRCKKHAVRGRVVAETNGCRDVDHILREIRQVQRGRRDERDFVTEGVATRVPGSTMSVNV